MSNHWSDIDFKDFMNLQKDNTKESYSFSVDDTTLSSNDPLRFRKNVLWNWAKGQSSANKNIRFKTSMLRSDSCDYSKLYIAVKGKTNVGGTNDANRINKMLSLKNNTLFRSSISK